MTRKTKFSIKFKESLIKQYLQGASGLSDLSKKHGIEKRYLRRLVHRYEKQGSLIQLEGNNFYEKPFKLKCVLSVLKNRLSLSRAAMIYGIPSDSTIWNWLNLYNKFGEEGLNSKPRGRPKIMSVPKKKKASSDSKLTALEEELEYLRAENAYLKKLNALVQQEKLKAVRSKSKPSKN